MPSAPLYYAPYMKALYDSTKIGSGDKAQTLEQLRDQQLSWDVELNPAGAPTGANPASAAAAAFDKDHSDQSNALGASAIVGVYNLQQAMHAKDPTGTWQATPIARYQFATSDEGAVANRLDTALRTNPTMLDNLKPEDVQQRAGSIVDQSKQDLQSHDVRFAGDTLDFGNATSSRLLQSTSGKALNATDMFAVADQVGREVQRTVTPSDPTKPPSPTDWIDDATATIGAHWPGAAAKVVEAMGLSKDLTKDWQAIEDASSQQRMMDSMAGAQAPYVRSLKALLGAAGVDTEAADAAPAAFQLLQAKPADQVPAGIVQAILAKAKLPTDDDALKYFTQRLADTGGQDGNVQGMLDSIELARRDQEAKQKPTPPADPGKPDPAKPDPATPDPSDAGKPGNTGTPGVPTMPNVPDPQGGGDQSSGAGTPPAATDPAANASTADTADTKTS